MDILEIFVGKNIRGNKKIELRVSLSISVIIIESEISYFNKSVLKSLRRKFFWMTLFAISVIKEK